MRSLSLNSSITLFMIYTKITKNKSNLIRCACDSFKKKYLQTQHSKFNIHFLHERALKLSFYKAIVYRTPPLILELYYQITKSDYWLNRADTLSTEGICLCINLNFEDVYLNWRTLEMKSRTVACTTYITNYKMNKRWFVVPSVDCELTKVSEMSVSQGRVQG